jgi:hypothetical protein
MTEPQSPGPTLPGGQILIYRDGTLNLHVRLDGRTVWLTQRMIAELYQVSVKTVNEHLVNIYGERELEPEATIRKFRIVQLEGNRKVTRTLDHYNLDAILSVGYRVRSHRGTQFRQWASARLSELLVKGFTIDDERIKAGRTIGQDYFDELLERIRDIRSSERLFYQKITDIYATSIDYDPKAEIIADRADSARRHMGLTTWKNAPAGPIRKADVTVAKNYLNEDEIKELNRIVTMYLDYAEDQARRRRPMHMSDWTVKLDAFLQFNERNILTHAGTISHQLACERAEAEFEKYQAEQRRLEIEEPVSDFNKILAHVKRIEEKSPKDRRKPYSEGNSRSRKCKKKDRDDA